MNAAEWSLAGPIIRFPSVNSRTKTAVQLNSPPFNIVRSAVQILHLFYLFTKHVFWWTVDPQHDGTGVFRWWGEAGLVRRVHHAICEGPDAVTLERGILPQTVPVKPQSVEEGLGICGLQSLKAGAGALKSVCCQLYPTGWEHQSCCGTGLTAGTSRERGGGGREGEQILS